MKPQKTTIPKRLERHLETDSVDRLRLSTAIYDKNGIQFFANIERSSFLPNENGAYLSYRNGAEVRKSKRLYRLERQVNPSSGYNRSKVVAVKVDEYMTTLLDFLIGLDWWLENVHSEMVATDGVIKRDEDLIFENVKDKLRERLNDMNAVQGVERVLFSYELQAVVLSLTEVFGKDWAKESNKKTESERMRG